jgi:hypothetical protein
MEGRTAPAVVCAGFASVPNSSLSAASAAATAAASAGLLAVAAAAQVSLFVSTAV